MIWLTFWLLFTLAAPVLLVLMLKPALAFEDGKTKKWLGVTLIAWLIDIYVARTTWPFLAGWPKRNEMTISHTLERLCDPENDAHPRYVLFFALAHMINLDSPTGNHIKVIAGMKLTRGPAA